MKRLLTKGLSVLGALVMLLTMLPMGIVSVSADIAEFDLPDGYTLQAIGTQEDLAAIKTGSAASKVYYYLTNDIEITTDTFGIGSNETTNAFRDILDGNGYAVTFSGSTGTGVALNGHGGWNGGLFFAMNGDAVVKNLTIKGAVTSTAQSTGAVVGQMVSGTIDHCVNHADITADGKNNIGGLAGRVQTGMVVNCMNYGEISGGVLTGGIVGGVSYATDMTEEEKTTGVVKVIIANCANFGMVIGREKTGGIIGLAEKDKSYRIDNCYNVGSIGLSQANSDRWGAIVCCSWPNAVITNNCYALDSSSTRMLETTTKMTQAEMQDAAFTETLNANVTAGISYTNTVGGEAITVPAVAWQANEGGYPTIPAVTPIVPKSDLTEAEQMEAIRQKLIAYFMEQDTFDDGATAGKCYTSKAGDYLAIQQADGSWEDVDYYCTQSAANGGTWEPYLVLDRMQAMAMAYANPDSEWYQDEAMRQGVENAFTYWDSIRGNPDDAGHIGPWSVNWWENANGVALRFSRIGIVMKDVLSAASTASVLRELDLNGSTSTGQNALWQTQNALYRALIADDAIQFKKVVDTNLAVNLGRGGLNDEAIQVDNSFHAHGNLLYSNGYGRSLFRDMSFWIDTLAGTDFALPQSVIDLMGEYMLDGTRWMIRGDMLEVYLGYTAMIKPGYAGNSYIKPIERMIKNDPKRAAEYELLLSTIKGEGGSTYNGLNGNNYMWTSALMSQMREGYGVNVRMLNGTMKSSEFRATWPDEDHGNIIFWTASGANTVLIDGDEYSSVYGTYDWRHVPGTTTPYFISMNYAVNNTNTDCWGVSNGQYGATAYTFNINDGTGAVPGGNTQGKIGYFFFDDEYVALGAGIGSNHAQPIHTTVNQAKAADVSVDGTAVTFGTDAATYTPDYVYNNQIGYIFPEETEVTLSYLDHEEKDYPSLWSTGYSQFGEQYDPADLPEPEDTFSLWIDHGVKPQGSSYAYIVLPDATEAEVAAYSENNRITIIANTDKVQAVRHEGLKQTQINFYEAGSLAYADGKTVTVDGACSLIIDESGDEIMISEAVSNTLNAKAINVVLDINGSITTTKFCSLEEPYAGKTITLEAGGNSLIQSGATTSGHSVVGAFDKNLETYWESTEEQAWISYDMQESLYVGNVLIRWGEEYATSYELQYSEDGVNWKTAYTQTNGQGGVETVPYNTIGRYWKLVCTDSADAAYQIKEITFNTSGNIALNKPVEVSFVYTPDMPAAYIVDGNASTRWAGERGVNNNWVVVDLGMDARVDGVQVIWENAYSSEYTVDVSDDGKLWSTAARVTCSGGTVQTALPTGTTGRYLRIQSVKAATGYGASIWELEVYGALQLDSDNVALEREAVDGRANIVADVTDGDADTVWSSDDAADSLTVDLGEAHQIDSVAVVWGDTHATGYTWQISDDNKTWSDAAVVTDGAGSTETATIAANARYVRLLLQQSSTAGYDVAELEVYGIAVADLNPDKTALKKAIDLSVRSDVYTEDSYQAYKNALAIASNVYASDKAIQKQVDAALDDLKAAYSALTFRNFGEVLATIPGQTVSIGSRQVLSVNWTGLDKTIDLSKDDLSQIYLFATVDITRDPDKLETGMFGNGRILLRSPNTEGENNAWVNTNTMITQLGRNVLYFPLSQMVGRNGTMDWSQVQTFRLYIDSVNKFDGTMTMTLSDVQIIRTTEPTKVKVACVGDSITAGNGASGTSTNYVSQLQKQLGTNYIVQNFGNSGKTLLKDSANEQGYVLTDTYKNSLAFEPDVVTIMLGTNDSKDENWSTLSGNYEQELRDLVNVYRNLPSKPIVILATSPTAYNRNWNINDAVVTGEIAPIQRKVAAAMGCPLIETNANTKNMADNFADGIHPNDAGYAVLAELFAEGITEAATRIYSFELAGQTGVVDHENNTIAVTVPADTDLSDLTPTIRLMQSATVSPAGKADFTKPVTLTVTAPDQENTRQYTVTVTKASQPVTVDKTVLEEALADAIADLSGYTAATAEAYTEALTNAQTVMDNANATQEQVDQALQALTAAQETLVAIVLGEVDGIDGISAADALMALQAATSKIRLTADQTKAANVDKTDEVTAADALRILQFATQKIGSF